MVRWSDGLFGGLIAGLLSALFFVIAGAAVIHEPVFGQYFLRFAVAVFGSRLESMPLVGVLFGLFLHVLASAIFGIVYALFAAQYEPSSMLPASVLCGVLYGGVMFLVAQDVVVPVMGVISYTPLWEALVGSVLFQGLVLAEYITIVHGRRVPAEPVAGAA